MYVVPLEAWLAFGSLGLVCVFPVGVFEGTYLRIFIRAKEELLKMTEIQPHEVLKAKGVVVEFEQTMGKAAFVSHQWVGHHHPDPEFKQMRVLQEALKNILTNLQSIPVDIHTEVMCNREPLSTSEFRTVPLSLWYDYFSCPQLEHEFGPHAGSGELPKAIDSIPAYVGKCSYFFALCPVVESEHLSQVFSPYTWAERG